MEEARKEIIEFGKKMAEASPCAGTAGNLSVYDPETGYMAIGPSGIDYFEIKPEDIVILDLDGNIVEGTRKPSSESGMHAAFYKEKGKKGIRACVHTHSIYCTTLACMNVPLEAVHYVIGLAGADVINCAPYATFGTPELAEKTVKACGDANAVLMANHGMMACGANLKAAYGLSESIEYAAEIQWRCMCAGKPVVLSKEDMAAAIEHLASYGQKK